ncbi:MAG: hypothetical protein E7L01_27355 [Paenibacillus macerans]|nr:hypothetical protein [Paenibacillus macerans]MCY7560611.1 hypothetical protein [Paenibacillus macerans]MDU7477029.1 hypothetical protein [Paenibacillus macerans]MEC0140961.1 hypothetical protein [Paenibacillus macerans]MEC0154963.1 hypothetical protein [Paenibacillus macerans]MEC0334212.1 hypothetical protein [Paenibacillus macerans]
MNTDYIDLYQIHNPDVASRLPEEYPFWSFMEEDDSIIRKAPQKAGRHN